MTIVELHPHPDRAGLAEALSHLGLTLRDVISSRKHRRGDVWYCLSYDADTRTYATHAVYAVRPLALNHGHYDLTNGYGDLYERAGLPTGAL